mgnify:CR=1 FL=1
MSGLRSSGHRGLSGIAVVTVAAVAVLGLAVAAAAARVDARIYATPKVLAEFALVDGAGKPFGKADLKGKWTLVLLGFTHCPDICPFTLQNLAHVKRELASRVSPDRLPRVVFVGVDPDRDRPVIGEYVRHFDDDFVGVTGAWNEVEKLVVALDGFVRISGKNKVGNHYDVRHSAVVSLLDSEGRLVAGINPPLQPVGAANFIAEMIIKHGRKKSAAN